MSIYHVTSSGLSNSSLSSFSVADTYPVTPEPPVPPTPTPTWTRNASWPALPTVLPTEQKIVALFAVNPVDSNFFAINVAGDYTVNYGDGTTTNYSSGTQANYNYSFTSPALDGTNAPVTITSADSRINRANHGYSNGSRVSLYGLTGGSGLIAELSYFVVNSTANNFQISLTENGTPVTITTNGTATLLPYKIATVVITPQVGSNLTSVNFNVKNAAVTTAAVTYSANWLDLKVSVPQATSLTLGASSFNIRYGMLENVEIVNHGNVTSFANLFRNFTVLIRVKVTSSVANVTTMANMFNSCPSLSVVEPFTGTVAAVTTMNQMFNSCYSLTTIPPFPGTVAAVTNMSQMFQNCFSLTTIPPFPGTVAAVTNMSSMFSGCQSLTTIPPFPGTVAAVTSMGGMFSGCFSLTTIPPFPGTVAAVTDMSQMFFNCYSLTTIPPFPGTVAAVTSMSFLFYECRSIRSIPPFSGSVAAVTNFQNMFGNCFSLTSIPAFPSALTATASASDIFMSFSDESCPSLARIPGFVFGNTFSVRNCNLSATALNEIYTNLPTVTAKTITVTGNYGVAGDNPAIATAKGWTVTG